MIEHISSSNENASQIPQIIPPILPTPIGQKTIQSVHWQNITSSVSTVQNNPKDKNSSSTHQKTQNNANNTPSHPSSPSKEKTPAAAPRYGHRVICVKDWLVLFGGGTQDQNGTGQICDDLYAFNTLTYQWLKLDATGDPGPGAIPPGVAAASLCSEGSRIFLFGGMSENCRFTNKLFELNMSNWTWKVHKTKINADVGIDIPSPRIGASMIVANDKIYMFGGLGNQSNEDSFMIPMYFNDLWTFTIKDSLMRDNPIEVDAANATWKRAETYGIEPVGRESHTAILDTDPTTGRQKMVVYGGMSGVRLSEVNFLELDSMTWKKIPSIGAPLPRSMHAASYFEVSERERYMLVFGGWTMAANNNGSQNTNLLIDEDIPQSKTDDSNIYAFNFDTYQWSQLSIEDRYYSHNPSLSQIHTPPGLAGHSLTVHSKTSDAFLLFGRNDERKDKKGTQISGEVYKLTLGKPKKIKKASAMKVTGKNAEIVFSTVPNAESYRIEIRKRPKQETTTKLVNPIVPVSTSKNMGKLQPIKLQPIKMSPGNLKPIGVSKQLSVQSPVYQWKLVKNLKKKEIKKSDEQLSPETQRHVIIETFFEDENDASSEVPLAKASSYEVRIRGENALGPGTWTQTSFKTVVPGLPSSPVDVDINVKDRELIHLSWSSVDAGRADVQFCIFIATRAVQKNAAKNVVWKKIWVGRECRATIARNDSNCKNMLVENGKTAQFRIAAKNSKGFGPATQIKFSLYDNKGSKRKNVCDERNRDENRKEERKLERSADRGESRTDKNDEKRMKNLEKSDDMTHEKVDQISSHNNIFNGKILQSPDTITSKSPSIFSSKVTPVMPKPVKRKKE